MRGAKRRGVKRLARDKGSREQSEDVEVRVRDKESRERSNRSCKEYRGAREW